MRHTLLPATLAAMAALASAGHATTLRGDTLRDPAAAWRDGAGNRVWPIPDPGSADPGYAGRPDVDSGAPSAWLPITVDGTGGPANHPTRPIPPTGPHFQEASAGGGGGGGGVRVPAPGPLGLIGGLALLAMWRGWRGGR